jgi:hypothetical protein
MRGRELIYTRQVGKATENTVSIQVFKKDQAFTVPYRKGGVCECGFE